MLAGAPENRVAWKKWRLRAGWRRGTGWAIRFLAGLRCRTGVKGAGRVQFTRELELLVHACRNPGAAALGEELQRPIDWDALLALVRRHDLAPAVAAALLDPALPVPQPVRERVRDHSRAAAKRMLQLAGEAARLQAAFDRAGIPCLFVKGPALAMLAYGSLARKHSVDLDLLVLPADAERATAVLVAQGCVASDDLDPAQFARFRRFSKERSFTSANGLPIELHWKLLDGTEVMAGVDATAPAQSVDLAGVAVRTLSDELLYAYIAYHGQVHGWSRLKWLCDVHGFAARRPERIAAFHARAKTLGAGRASGAALLLCAELFGLALDPALERELRREPAVRWLLAVSRRTIADPMKDGRPSLYSPRTLALQLANLRRNPNRRALADDLALTWSVPMQRALDETAGGWRYHLLRGPLLLWRLPGRLLAARSGRGA